MLYSIFIFKENGVVLYSRRLKETPGDTQVLVGFFASIANFSKEALQSTISQVDLGGQTQLVMHYRPKEELVIAAMADSRDDALKIKQILSTIATEFLDEYGANVEENQINTITLTESIIDMVRQSSRIRGRVMQIASLCFLIATYIGLYFVMEASMSPLFQAINPSVGPTLTEKALYFEFLPRVFAISLLYVFVTVPLPAFITGFVAGEKQSAWMIFFVVFTVATIALFFILQTLLSVVAIIYSPFSLVIGLVFSWIGARFAEKRKLYA